ncbi:YfiT family bacillithiol transferase [Paenibacillus polymyxa]|uniref:YfiT family bacillithiol transferase n=1 Tax=Paenibacillus polymyxa TaxID=1406 RepID=UPI0023784E2B|nr:bacillithiol transferase BstA [Paenibacillus polymyxa]WDM23358.1 bacillithiol transferase BstA [Paenibacillus polymyxa]
MDKDLRYPIGSFVVPDTITEEQLIAWIHDIAELPAQLRQAVEGLNEQQLNTPYREGGWTIRQVVHHVADSHMNSYIRFKLALTEDTPTIKPYDEGRWAEIPDARELPLEPSLQLLEGLHERWVTVLRSLGEDQLHRSFIHPESGQTTRLERNIGIYAWHGKHHTAHITSLRERNAW